MCQTREGKNAKAEKIKRNKKGVPTCKLGLKVYRTNCSLPSQCRGRERKGDHGMKKRKSLFKAKRCQAAASSGGQ